MPLVDSYDSLGEPEVALHKFQFRVGRNKRVEGRIQSDDRIAARRLRVHRAEREPCQNKNKQRRFLHVFLHSTGNAARSVRGANSLACTCEEVRRFCLRYL